MPLEAGRLLREMAVRLREAGSDTAMLDARLILMFVTGLTEIDLIARSEAVVTTAQHDAIEKLLQRRINGEPASRLLGYKEFYGRRFHVSPATLDPRPDTEILVEAALCAISDIPSPEILDLGTGTGAIIITLLGERADASGWATDISDEALVIAKQNAMAHGVSGRMKFTTGNWFDGVTGPFDLIVSNPPYIPAAEVVELSREVRDHDPVLALDGGDDGLLPYREIFRDCSRFLKPEGHVIVEFGQGQQDEVRAIAQCYGLVLDTRSDAMRPDLAGIIRCAHFRHS